MSVSVEAGVPLYDSMPDSMSPVYRCVEAIWVIIPLELELDGWRCDMMILRGGEVAEVHQGVVFSGRFLSNLHSEAPCLKSGRPT